MDIVRACLAADPRRAHRRVDDLDALGRLVGVDGGELIAARGRAALAAGDGDAAAAAAEELVARRVASAWDVVADVVAAAEFADAEDVAEDGGDVGDVGCGAGARVGADAANGGSGEYDASASSPGWTPPDAAARRKFQAFALAHAPADRAPELLAAWQNMETTRFAERAIETREGDEGADANSDPSNLDDPSTALRVAAPDLRASATTRPRPRLRAFVERYLSSPRVGDGRVERRRGVRRGVRSRRDGGCRVGCDFRRRRRRGVARRTRARPPPRSRRARDGRGRREATSGDASRRGGVGELRRARARVSSSSREGSREPRRRDSTRSRRAPPPNRRRDRSGGEERRGELGNGPCGGSSVPRVSRSFARDVRRGDAGEGASGNGIGVEIRRRR